MMLITITTITIASSAPFSALYSPFIYPPLIFLTRFSAFFAFHQTSLRFISCCRRRAALKCRNGLILPALHALHSEEFFSNVFFSFFYLFDAVLIPSI